MTGYLALLLILFFVLMLIGMPVAYAMAVASVATIMLDPNMQTMVIPQKIFTSMDSFSLMAVPFFMMAGSLMEISGITQRLIDFAKSLVGHLTGGLGHASIVTGILMAGVSGSANADTSALASILVPALTKEGYEPGYSCAMVASAGALGPVIPPSIMMVIYAGVTSISIGTMFLAGFVPGLMIGIGYMIVNFLYAKRAGIERPKFAGWKQLGIDFVNAIPALVLPLIIIGGILSGVVTATESGVLACVYAALYGLVRKKLNFNNLFGCITSAINGTVNTMVIVAFACLFGMLATNYNMGKVVLSVATIFHGNGSLILLFVSIVLFIAGMFIDSTAAMLMLIPIFAPLITQYGFNPLHFAMVCILTLDMGGLSPPVGLLIYLAANITKTKLERVVRYIWRFIAVNYTVTILVILIPWLVMIIPRLAGAAGV